MLDDLLELILELILDGMVEAAGNKAVPKPVWILLSVILALAFLAFFGLLLYIGIDSGSIVMIVITVTLFCRCRTVCFREFCFWLPISLFCAVL